MFACLTLRFFKLLSYVLFHLFPPLLDEKTETQDLKSRVLVHATNEPLSENSNPDPFTGPRSPLLPCTWIIVAQLGLARGSALRHADGLIWPPGILQVNTSPTSLSKYTQSLCVFVYLFTFSLTFHPPFSVSLLSFSSFLPSSPPTNTLIFSYTGMVSHWQGGWNTSIFKVPGSRIFSYGFLLFGLFCQANEKDPKVPLSQANQRMPSSFCFCFQAGSLQMHPEGHSQVPKIGAGNQSHPGHQHHSWESHEWEHVGKGRGEPELPQNCELRKGDLMDYFLQKFPGKDSSKF